MSLHLVFSIKMMNHKIHMNSFNELLKEVFLCYSKVVRSLLLLFGLDERIVYSFSFSVKMIKHKIHMNFFTTFVLSTIVHKH